MGDDGLYNRNVFSRGAGGWDLQSGWGQGWLLGASHSPASWSLLIGQAGSELTLMISFYFNYLF